MQLGNKMEYYRLAFSYERFIDTEWDYTEHTLKPHKENLSFIDNFTYDTGLTPIQSLNKMYFFVDCDEEQSTYIKMKYFDIVISEEKIEIDMEPVDVSK